MTEAEIRKAVKHLSRNDKILAGLIKEHDLCELTSHNDYFVSLLRAITGQQLSVKAADSIYGRFNTFFKKRPTAKKILETPDETLRGLGLSNAKVKYVKDLSYKYLKKELSLKDIDKKPTEEIIEELVKVKGIGVWSAHMFLIFTLARRDVLPVGDLGIKKAVMINYDLPGMPDEAGVTEVSRKNNWSPYNSVAAWYLWRSLNNN